MGCNQSDNRSPVSPSDSEQGKMQTIPGKENKDSYGVYSFFSRVALSLTEYSEKKKLLLDIERKLYSQTGGARAFIKEVMVDIRRNIYTQKLSIKQIEELFLDKEILKNFIEGVRRDCIAKYNSGDRKSFKKLLVVYAEEHITMNNMCKRGNRKVINRARANFVKDCLRTNKNLDEVMGVLKNHELVEELIRDAKDEIS